MSHVRLNQMPRRESAAETELPGENTGSYDASKPTCIVARIRKMGAANSKKIEHRTLWFENRAASNRADFNGRHRDTDLKTAIETNVY